MKEKMETGWKHDGNDGNRHEIRWKKMETIETELVNEGIEWKHDGNDGNRA